MTFDSTHQNLDIIDKIKFRVHTQCEPSTVFASPSSNHLMHRITSPTGGQWDSQLLCEKKKLHHESLTDMESTIQSTNQWNQHDNEWDTGTTTTTTTLSSVQEKNYIVSDLNNNNNILTNTLQQSVDSATQDSSVQWNINELGASDRCLHTIMNPLSFRDMNSVSHVPISPTKSSMIHDTACYSSRQHPEGGDDSLYGSSDIMLHPLGYTENSRLSCPLRELIPYTVRPRLWSGSTENMILQDINTSSLLETTQSFPVDPKNILHDTMKLNDDHLSTHHHFVCECRHNTQQDQQESRILQQNDQFYKKKYLLTRQLSQVQTDQQQEIRVCPTPLPSIINVSKLEYFKTFGFKQKECYDPNHIHPMSRHMICYTHPLTTDRQTSPSTPPGLNHLHPFIHHDTTDCFNYTGTTPEAMTPPIMMSRHNDVSLLSAQSNKTADSSSSSSVCLLPTHHDIIFKQEIDNDLTEPLSQSHHTLHDQQSIHHNTQLLLDYLYASTHSSSYRDLCSNHSTHTTFINDTQEDNEKKRTERFWDLHEPIVSQKRLRSSIVLQSTDIPSHTTSSTPYDELFDLYQQHSSPTSSSTTESSTVWNSTEYIPHHPIQQDDSTQSTGPKGYSCTFPRLLIQQQQQQLPSINDACLNNSVTHSTTGPIEFLSPIHFIHTHINDSTTVSSPSHRVHLSLSPSSSQDKQSYSTHSTNDLSDSTVGELPATLQIEDNSSSENHLPPCSIQNVSCTESDTSSQLCPVFENACCINLHQSPTPNHPSQTLLLSSENDTSHHLSNNHDGFSILPTQTQHNTTTLTTLSSDQPHTSEQQFSPYLHYTVQNLTDPLKKDIKNSVQDMKVSFIDQVNTHSLMYPNGYPLTHDDNDRNTTQTTYNNFSNHQSPSSHQSIFHDMSHSTTYTPASNETTSTFETQQHVSSVRPDPHHTSQQGFYTISTDSLSAEYKKLLRNIPRKSREAFTPSDLAAFRTCHPHYSRNCFILMQNGYDIRLGEVGRAALKKEISRRLKGDSQLRERCVSVVCRLKNANVLQLLQMAEISGCLNLGLKISSGYWKEYSRKQRPGGTNTTHTQSFLHRHHRDRSSLYHHLNSHNDFNVPSISTTHNTSSSTINNQSLHPQYSYMTPTTTISPLPSHCIDSTTVSPLQIDSTTASFNLDPSPSLHTDHNILCKHTHCSLTDNFSSLLDHTIRHDQTELLCRAPPPSTDSHTASLSPSRFPNEMLHHLTSFTPNTMHPSDNQSAHVYHSQKQLSQLTDTMSQQSASLRESKRSQSVLTLSDILRTTELSKDTSSTFDYLQQESSNKLCKHDLYDCHTSLPDNKKKHINLIPSESDLFFDHSFNHIDYHSTTNELNDEPNQHSLESTSERLQDWTICDITNESNRRRRGRPPKIIPENTFYNQYLTHNEKKRGRPRKNRSIELLSLQSKNSTRLDQLNISTNQQQQQQLNSAVSSTTTSSTTLSTDTTCPNHSIDIFSTYDTTNPFDFSTSDNYLPPFCPEPLDHTITSLPQCNHVESNSQLLNDPLSTMVELPPLSDNHNQTIHEDHLISEKNHLTSHTVYSTSQCIPSSSPSPPPLSPTPKSTTSDSIQSASYTNQSSSSLSSAELCKLSSLSNDSQFSSSTNHTQEQQFIFDTNQYLSKSNGPDSISHQISHIKLNDSIMKCGMGMPLSTHRRVPPELLEETSSFTENYPTWWNPSVCASILHNSNRTENELLVPDDSQRSLIELKQNNHSSNISNRQPPLSIFDTSRNAATDEAIGNLSQTFFSPEQTVSPSSTTATIAVP